MGENNTTTLVNILQYLLVPVLVAVVSAWVTVRLSLKRFRSEKWWELKAETYMHMLEALHGLKRYFTTHLNAIEGDEIFSSKEENQLEAEWLEAFETLEQYYDEGEFAINTEALGLIEMVLDEFDVPEPSERKYILWENPEREKYFKKREAIASSAVKSLGAIARKDLKAK